MNRSYLVLGLALSLSVAAFVLAVWPVVGQPPWGYQGTVIMKMAESADSESQPQLANDALRLKCHTRLKYMRWTVVNDPVQDRIFHEFMNLGCLDLVGLEIPVDVLQGLCKEHGSQQEGCPRP